MLATVAVNPTFLTLVQSPTLPTKYYKYWMIDMETIVAFTKRTICPAELERERICKTLQYNKVEFGNIRIIKYLE